MSFAHPNVKHRIFLLPWKVKESLLLCEIHLYFSTLVAILLMLNCDNPPTTWLSFIVAIVRSGDSMIKGQSCHNFFGGEKMTSGKNYPKSLFSKFTIIALGHVIDPFC